MKLPKTAQNYVYLFKKFGKGWTKRVGFGLIDEWFSRVALE